jgi:hypothetical protein
MWKALLIAAVALYVLRRFFRKPRRVDDPPPPVDQPQASDCSWRDLIVRAGNPSGDNRREYRDIFCADGVYLPLVGGGTWSASPDHRWIMVQEDLMQRSYLIDRQSRCVWHLRSGQLNQLSAWLRRLPRWTTQPDHLPEKPIDAKQPPLSDAQFSAWMNEHDFPPSEPLSAVRDLWIIPGDRPPKSSNLIHLWLEENFFPVGEDAPRVDQR